MEGLPQLTKRKGKLEEAGPLPGYKARGMGHASHPEKPTLGLENNWDLASHPLLLDHPKKKI